MLQGPDTVPDRKDINVYHSTIRTGKGEIFKVDADRVDKMVSYVEMKGSRGESLESTFPYERWISVFERSGGFSWDRYLPPPRQLPTV
jgi:hypothetical protein